MILPVLLVLVTIAVSVTVQVKDGSNQSAIDQVKYVIRFLREQKVYRYYYTYEFPKKIPRRKQF